MSHQLSDSDKEPWTLVQNQIKEKVTPQQFTTWFSGLNLVKLDANEIYISAPNSFCKEWIENNYIDTITSSLEEASISNRKIKFIIENTSSSRPKPCTQSSDSSPIGAQTLYTK